MEGKFFISERDRIVAQVDIDLEDLIPGYFENREKDITAMLQALNSDDFVTIQCLGHSMKGSGGGYGFDGISEVGLALEDAAKVRDAKKIGVCIKWLEGYLEHVEIKYV